MATKKKSNRVSIPTDLLEQLIQYAEALQAEWGWKRGASQKLDQEMQDLSMAIDLGTFELWFAQSNLPKK